MRKIFVKTIEKSSNEHLILEFFRNVDKEEQKHFIQIYNVRNHPTVMTNINVEMEYQSKTLDKLFIEKKTVDSQKCFQDIFRVFSLLEKYRIIHQDVHLKNILFNPRKKKFYLIDFGLAKFLKVINATNWYEYYYYHLRGDLFQFCWNFVFRDNKPFNNFQRYRKKISNYKEEKKNRVKKALQNSIFYPKTICSTLCEKWLTHFFIVDYSFVFQNKREKILFKFLIQRLYLIDYYINKKDLKYLYDAFLKS